MTTPAIIISAIFVLLIFVIVFVYNKYVKNKNRMQEAWSIIDVYLKKRYDLIPNLVEIVKGYASYEKSALEEVTLIRTQAMQSQTVESKSVNETLLDKALVHLFGVVEKYPELKANNSFLELQEQISQVENDLEKARRYYNGTVRVNNIFIESFPVNLVAGLFNFHKGSFFQIDHKEKESANISFI